MSKLLLLDKDGTLIKPRKDKFVQTPWDQVPLPGVTETLDSYRFDGWKMAIISNQGGVAAGHKSLENTILEMRFCLELFPQISEAYFCPDFEGNNCWRGWGDCGTEHQILYTPTDSIITELELAEQFRKPNPGMLTLAIHELESTEEDFAEEVLYVGDRPEDEGAAAGANVKFKWASEFFSS